MDERSGAALLALADYVRLARSRTYTSVLVPLLCAYALHLPAIRWRHKSYFEPFTCAYTRQLLAVAAAMATSDPTTMHKTMIMSTLRQCGMVYSSTTAMQHRRHLAGMLVALGDPAYAGALVDSEEEWKIMLLHLLPHYPPSKRPRVCGLIMSLLQTVVHTCTAAEVSSVFRVYVAPVIRHSSSLDARTKRDAKLLLLLESMDLGASMAELHAAFMHDMVKLSIALLVHAVDKGCQGDSWAGWMQVGRAALSGVTRMCLAHSDELVLSVVTDLSGMLLHSRRLLRHPDQRDVRLAITECLATILRHDLHTVADDYATSVTRKVVFSLLNSLYKDASSSSSSSSPSSDGPVAMATPRAFTDGGGGGSQSSSSSVSVSDMEQHLSGDQVQLHALRLVGTLTHLLDSALVTKEVLPVMTQRFLERPKAMHVVVPHLMSVAFSGGDDLPFFNEILQLLTTTYHRPHSPDNKYNIREISDAFVHMAERLVGGGDGGDGGGDGGDPYFKWRHVLLRSLLKLFSELGAEINELAARSDVGGVSETSMIGVLGVMLPALATLMTHTADNDDGTGDRSLYYDLDRNDPHGVRGINVFANTDNNVSWFMRVWFLFTIFNFSSSTTTSRSRSGGGGHRHQHHHEWPNEWFNAVRHIARHTPVLVSRSSHKSFVSSLDAVVARLGASRAQVSRAKKGLQNAFPHMASTITGLTDACCMYLLSVYALERLRVESRGADGYFYGLFEYLCADSLDDTEIIPMIACITDAVFDDFLAFTAGTEGLSQLTAQTIFLVRRLTSRYKLVRDKAHAYLTLLTAQHKHVQWSEACVREVLNSVDAITRTVEEDEGLCTTSLHVALNARRSIRVSVVEKLRTLAVSWLRNAQYLVPSRIESVLQNYTNAASTSSPSHHGVALALSVSTSKVARLLCGASMQERCLGEIAGMCAASAPGDSLVVQLTRDISAILAAFNRPGSDERTLEQRLGRLILRAGALLIYASSSSAASSSSSDNAAAAAAAAVDSREIIHLVVKVPVKVFTPRVMKTAMWTWTWILSACEQQQLSLLMEIKAAWSYAIDRGKGLFSNEDANVRDQRRAHLRSDLPAPNHDDTDRFVAHSMWIQFLYDRFIPVTGCVRDHLNALTMMLHKAFARPELLSTARNAFAPRFQLVLLGLKMLQQRAVRLEVRDRRLLRGRLYHAAFQWFFIESYWFDPQTRESQVHQHMELVIEVCKALQNEDQFWDESDDITATTPATAAAAAVKLVSGVSTSNMTMAVSSSSSSSAATGASGGVNASASAAPPLSMRRSASTHARSVSIHSALHKSSGSSGSAAGGSDIAGATGRGRAATIMIGDGCALSEDSMSILLNVGHSERHKQERLRHVRALLYFLVCHECDRMSLWHNPTRTSSKQQSKDARVHTTARFVSQREWGRFMNTAWMVDARLAVLITKRFPNVPVLRTMLRRLVVESPDAVYHIPEAAMYLIESGGHDNIRHHLIYWAPCELYRALQLLVPPYVNNQAINAYAVHSLRCHSFDEVMFYLPQLIQSLRFDQRRLLRTYMVEATQSSILLAHQLVWMCEAELGTESADIVIDVDDPHRASIRQLIAEIKAAFGAAEADYFNAEFAFFERITTISGVLKPIEVVGDKAATKELRKERIRAELEAIPTITPAARLYLPTNPTCELVSVVTRSGTPMQSAAKVPILVAFQCRRTSMVKKCPDNLMRVREYLHRLQHTTTTAVVDGDGDGGSDGDGGDGGGGDGNGDDPSAPVLDMPDFDATHAQPESRRQSIATPTAAAAAAAPTSQQQQPPTVVASDDREVFTQACIFKVGDDVRQDALALQMIRLCRRIWQSVGLDLFVYPYSVLPNRIDDLIGGVIECVPNAQTRDEIGKATACSLKDHFVITFGREEGEAYQEAQRNFVLSLAGYAIVSYLLQAKDRHNGNLMIDSAGRVIHIDFGFIFDISPGRDMKFERAGFKLTLEMIEIMDGSSDTPLYKWFTELIVRGFLAVREHQEQICALVETMTHSDIRCFKPYSMDNLRARFFPEKDEVGAALAMKGIISEAYNNFRTNMYDYIQNMQQNIYYWRGYPGDKPN